MVADPCSLYWLREGGWRALLKSNLVGKRWCEKKFGMVEKKLKRRWKLTVVAFCRWVEARYIGNGPLIPLLTEGEGGWPALLTEEQFNWKKLMWEKNGMVKKNRNKRQTHHHRLLHATRGWGWWWRALVPFTHWGRVASVANWIPIK